MNTQKSLGKGLMIAGIVLALIFSVTALNKAGTAIIQQMAPALGATPTLDNVDNPFMSIGGFRTFTKSNSITASSSVVCSFQNPFNATTSIAYASLNIVGAGMAQAQTIDLSTSTTALASSSPALIFAASVGANSEAHFEWYNSATSSTNANFLPFSQLNGSNNYFLRTGEYLNWRIATSAGSVMSAYYGGTCTVILRKL